MTATMRLFSRYPRTICYLAAAGVAYAAVAARGVWFP